MAKVKLAGNADAVEFCPNEPYLHVLAAASYTLQEGHGEQGGAARLGGLYLFSAEEEEEGEGHPSSTPGLKKLYHRETPGVFDIKWRPYDDGPPCLAQASADGSLSLHKLEECPDPSEKLELCENAAVDVSNSMCLYVDWNPVHSNPEVVVSHSDGSISLINVGQSEPEISSSWQAHDFEAWVVAYDASRTHIVYSGGDDCQFCCWDLREDTSRPAFRDRKTHSMGVCSIQGNPLWENMLITGSYDESVRLFDVRMTQKPLLKTELGLGGGVWRLKWHPTRRDILLSACMHNGAAIVQVEEGGFQVLEQYTEHTSLTYGASWCQGDLGDALDLQHDVSKENRELEAKGGEKSCSSAVANSGEREAEKGLQNVGATDETIESDLGLENSMQIKALVATCSFYDRAVHLWRPRPFAFSPKVT